MLSFCYCYVNSFLPYCREIIWRIILSTLIFGQSLERVLKFKNLLLSIILFFFSLLLCFLIDVAKISGLFLYLCYCFVIAMLIFSCCVLKNLFGTLYKVHTLEPPKICLVSPIFKSFRYFLLFITVLF